MVWAQQLFVGRTIRRWSAETGLIVEAGKIDSSWLLSSIFPIEKLTWLRLGIQVTHHGKTPTR